MYDLLGPAVGGVATFFILAGELMASPAGIVVWIALALFFISRPGSGQR